MSKPRKWPEVYPHGTPEGDEEARFFRALARGETDYVSTSAIMLTSGLSRERVEEIIDKYIGMNPPLIYAHKTNEEHWAYWERIPDEIRRDGRSLSEKDKDIRINKLLGNTSPDPSSSNDWRLDL